MSRLLPCLALSAALLAASCGPPPGTEPGPDGATTPRVAIDSKNTPPADGYFRIALATNPPALDPILVSDTTSDGLATKIFNTLVGYDSELRLVPELAEAMPEISDDGLTYTFRLREGVRFHTGREVVAEDVKYSLTRLASTPSKRFNVIQPIAGADEAKEAARTGAPLEVSGIEAVDPRTVRITLKEPYAPFLYLLAMVNAAVVPQEEVEAKGDRFSREPVGTGPFRLVEWVENDRLVLERHEDYFEGRPVLAGLRYRVIPEPLARQQEYVQGNLELVDVVSGMYDKWSSSNHAEDVLEWPQLAIEYYGFNLEKAGSPYAGRTDESARKLREAINWAVDRDHICRNILENRRRPANGIVPQGMPGHAEERPAFSRDVERAKRLLAEAGYPEGEGLPPVDLWFNQQGDNAAIAQAVQQDLNGLGIPIRLRALDWAAFLDATDAGEPAFFRLGWVADYPDPENFLFFLFHSSNKGPQGNVTFYDNPEVDRLIDESYAMTDREARLAQLQRAEELILEDHPWLFLTFNKEVILRKPYVEGFEPTGMDDDVHASQVDWHLVSIGGPQG